MADKDLDKEMEEELDQIIEDIASEEDTEQQSAPLKLVKGTKEESISEHSDQVLSMQLTGPINLRLSFSNGDRAIEIECSEDGLLCRMADGTEFKIPTTAVRKAA
ncbi:MAG: hypothetical protein M9962_14200 [Oligoflexia bacterium]|nr:hypothetical protein [Oligoflexia bacterium]